MSTVTGTGGGTTPAGDVSDPRAPRAASVVDALPVGVVVTDAGGRVRTANRAAGRLLGVREAALVGHALDEIGLRVADADGVEDPAFTWPAARVAATGHAAPPSTVGVAVRDGWRWLQVSCVPRPGEDDGAGGAVTTLVDVGGHVGALAALRASEEHYRQLVDNQGDAVMRLTPEGGILDTSPAADRLLALPPGGTATDLLALVHPEDRSCARAGLLRCMHGRQDVVVRFRLRRGDGGQVWVETVGNPVRDDGGHVLGVQVSARDVTQSVEREQDEAALHRLAEAVVGGAGLDEVFAALTREVGAVSEADAVTLVRFEGLQGEARGHWNRRGLPHPGIVDLAGGDAAWSAVWATGRASTAPASSGARARAGRGAVVGVPVHVGGVLWGCLAAECERGPGPTCQARLMRFAELAALAITAGDERRRLRRSVTLDPATGLADPAEFRRRLDAETARARRHGRPLSVLVIDLDGVPGEALPAVAALVRASSRAHDVPARTGPARLAVILAETGEDGARTAAMRLRAASGLTGAAAGGSLTTGAATLRPGEDAARLLSRAEADAGRG